MAVRKTFLKYLNEVGDPDPTLGRLPPTLGDVPTYAMPTVDDQPHDWFYYYSQHPDQIPQAKKLLDRKFRNPADANLYYQALRRAAQPV